MGKSPHSLLDISFPGRVSLCGVTMATKATMTVPTVHATLLSNLTFTFEDFDKVAALL